MLFHQSVVKGQLHISRSQHRLVSVLATDCQGYWRPLISGLINSIVCTQKELLFQIRFYRIQPTMAARKLDPIDCSDQPLDIAFHPSKPLMAAGLVDGTIECKNFLKIFYNYLPFSLSKSQLLKRPIVLILQFMITAISFHLKKQK